MKQELEEIFLRHCVPSNIEGVDYSIEHSSLALLLDDIDCSFGVRSLATSAINPNNTVININVMEFYYSVKHSPGDRVFNDNFTYIPTIHSHGLLDFTGGTVGELYVCDKNKIAEFDYVEYICCSLYENQQNVGGVIIANSKNAQQYKDMGLNVLVKSEDYPPNDCVNVKFINIYCSNIDQLSDILALKPIEINFRGFVFEKQHFDLILNTKLQKITVNKVSPDIALMIFNSTNIPIVTYLGVQFTPGAFLECDDKYIVYTTSNNLTYIKTQLLRNPRMGAKSARNV